MWTIKEVSRYCTERGGGKKAKQIRGVVGLGKWKGSGIKRKQRNVVACVAEWKGQNRRILEI